MPSWRLTQKGRVTWYRHGIDWSLTDQERLSQLVVSNAQLAYLLVYLKQLPGHSLHSLRRFEERKGWVSPGGSACCGTKTAARPGE